MCFCTIIHECLFAPTGFKGGALSSHAPRAGAAPFGHHDGELVQRVWLQTRHHVVQAGGVGHLETHRQTHTINNNSVCLIVDYIH